MTLRSLPAAAWTAMILLATLAPASWLGPESPAGPPSWLERLLGPLPLDKMAHASMFVGFGLLWRWAGASTRQAFLGGLAVAMLSELGQSIPVLERSTDLADLIADLLGLAVALAICRPRRAPVAEPAATTE